jgi:hypothetical protein
VTQAEGFERWCKNMERASDGTFVPIDLEDRFWSKVDKNGPTPEHAPHLGPCWIWLASSDYAGYGRFEANRGQKTISAPRMAWELHHRAKMDRRLVPDHLCRNPKCVKPFHLEAVTYQENALRGIGPPSRNARKTKCMRGHDLEFVKCTTVPAWRRYCPTCARVNSERYRRKMREKKLMLKMTPAQGELRATA